MLPVDFLLMVSSMHGHILLIVSVMALAIDKVGPRLGPTIFVRALPQALPLDPRKPKSKK